MLTVMNSIRIYPHTAKKKKKKNQEQIKNNTSKV